MHDGIRIERHQRPRRKKRARVPVRVPHIALNVHSEPRRLWDGQTKVERNRCRDAAQAYEEAPYRVDVPWVRGVVVGDGGLVCDEDDGGYDRGD